MRPSASFTGEMVSEIFSREPSFRTPNRLEMFHSLAAPQPR